MNLLDDSPERNCFQVETFVYFSIAFCRDEPGTRGEGMPLATLYLPLQFRELESDLRHLISTLRCLLGKVDRESGVCLR